MNTHIFLLIFIGTLVAKFTFAQSMPWFVPAFAFVPVAIIYAPIVLAAVMWLFYR